MFGSGCTTTRLFRDTVEMVSRKSSDPDGEGVNEVAAPQPEVYQGITVEDLIAKWDKTVLELQKKGILITNAQNALEGALSIRYLGV